MGFKPAISKSFVSVLICLGLLCSLSSCDVSRTAEEYVKEAKELYAAHEIEAAIIELKNALGQDRDYADARVLLGEIYAARGQAEAAEKELKKALELGVQLEKVLLPLGNALLDQGKHVEVLDTMSIEAGDSARVVAMKSVLLGDAYFQKGDFKAAHIYYSNAENSEIAVLANLGLAKTAGQFGDFALALENIDKALLSDPENPRIWVAKAELHRAIGENQLSKAAFTRVTEVSHDDQSSYYQLGMRQVIFGNLQDREIDQAEQNMKRLEATWSGGNKPKDIFIVYLRSLLAMLNEDYSRASELAKEILATGYEFPEANFIAGFSDAAEGKSEQAQVQLQAYLKARPENALAKRTLAYAQINSNRPQEAMATVMSISESPEDLETDLLALAARASLALGKLEQSSDLYSVIVKRQPDIEQYRIALAQSLVIQRKFDEAITVLEPLTLVEDWRAQALLSIVEVKMKAERYQSALESLQSLESAMPGKALPLSLQGTCYHLLDDGARARDLFKRAIETEPGFAPATRYLAELEVAAGKPDAALELLQKFIALKPEVPEVQVDYARILEQQGESMKAEAAFLKVWKLDEENANTALDLARFYLRSNRASAALEVLGDFVDTKNPGIYAERGNAYMMLESFNNALPAYRQLAALVPDSPKPDHLIAQAYVGLEDVRSAKTFLERAVQKDSDFQPSWFALLNIAMGENDVLAAEKALIGLETAGVGTTVLLGLRAQSLMRAGNADEAAALYRESYAISPSEDILEKFVQSLWVAGDREDATAILEKAMKQEPVSRKLLFLQATMLEAGGKSSEAEAVYRSILEEDQDHAPALNNLAWLLRESNPGEALGYAQRAVTLQPANPAMQDTLTEVQKLARD